MKFFGDFHIHSHYSRATSRQLTPEYLDYYGRIKGIQLIGTGDFTHAGWLAELRERLEPAEEGLFRLKKGYSQGCFLDDPRPVRFMLSAEISNIYKKGDKVRKVHNVILAPDFETVERINSRLESLGGNLRSDGRPILGLDSRDLLEIALEANERGFFFPAHIWTPWFSAMGSKSGFDSIQECYADLAPHIHAIETGLSTDAPMNWMVSSLDAYTLLSNSDAHSPDKLGRNGNYFDTEMSYAAITGAITSGDGFLGTVDTYPQAGKYHYDGHRKCNVCFDPVKTIEHSGKCPVCGRSLTIGVMSRIAELCDRTDIEDRPGRKAFFPIIPLKELLGEIEGASPASKKVEKRYTEILNKFGDETHILVEMESAGIAAAGEDLLALALQRMRERKVHISEGYDGEYGRITVFDKGEVKEMNAGSSLFGFDDKPAEADARPLLNFSLGALQKVREKMKSVQPVTVSEKDSKVAPAKKFSGPLSDLNPEQTAAVMHEGGAALVLAGPGTGKTKTISSYIYYLIRHKGVNPEGILALTFTNKAAGEMRERIAKMSGNVAGKLVFTGTFHSLGLGIISENLAETGQSMNFHLIDKTDSVSILKEITYKSDIDHKVAVAWISGKKQMLGQEDDADMESIFDAYQNYLRDNGIFDLDDLLWFPVQILSGNETERKKWQDRFSHIVVDEYQDTNPVQYRLLQLLQGDEGQKLFIVGDPNQSIYGFRGTNVGYIRKFMDDHPDTSVYNLKTSYRCTKTILRSSSGILSEGGQNELDGIKDGVKIKISDYPGSASEAEGIARKIEQLAGGMGFFSIDSSVVDSSNDDINQSLSEFAILTRTKRQFEEIRKALRNHNIPYNEAAEDPFWKGSDWRVLLDVMEFLWNPVPYFEKKLSKAGVTLSLQKPEGEDGAEWIGSLCDQLGNKFEFAETEKRKLMSMAKGISVPAFIQQLKTGHGSDTIDRQMEMVQLITMHSSKGLEFDTVFIPGLADGIVPYSMGGKQSDVHEEERLLYVAMTRAKNNLFLSHAQQVVVFGKSRSMQASRFLKRIDEKLKELEKTERKLKKKDEDKEDGQLELF